MATRTTRTSFRIITEDGELSHEHVSESNGYSMADFERYIDAHPPREGEIAQWHVVAHEDGDSDILAEVVTIYGTDPSERTITKLPAADLFD